MYRVFILLLLYLRVSGMCLKFKNANLVTGINKKHFQTFKWTGISLPFTEKSIERMYSMIIPIFYKNVLCVLLINC